MQTPEPPSRQQQVSDVAVRTLGRWLRWREAWLGRRFKPLHIMFTPHDGWEPPLRKSFAYSRHKLKFLAVTQANLQGQDLVVPLTLKALEELHPYRLHLLNHTLLPLPGRASVALCSDKLRCWQALSSHGFGAFLPPVGRDLTPPFIIKPREGEGGEGCVMIHNAEQAKAHAQLMADPHYYCQQAVENARQHAAHILFRDGRIVHMMTVAHYFDSSLPVQGQERARLSRLSFNLHQDLFTDMLRALGFDGLCCIDYKPSLSGPQVLEINPRFGGGLIPYFPSMLRHLAEKTYGDAH